MPQYAMLIYTRPPAADDPPSTHDRRAHDSHAQELEEAGAMVAAFALQPGAYATSIRGDAITDGPFIDSKEVIAGFAIIEAPDLDAAIELARRNPATQQGGGVEVRPVESGGIPALDRCG
jgi:hypothetical protein